MSSLQQNWRKGQSSFCLKVRGVGDKGKIQGAWEEMAPTMYVYMNK
jgi:hypothetical protein